MKNSLIQTVTEPQIIENIPILADLLFESGHIIVDSEWVDFSVEAVLKQKERRVQGKSKFSTIIETQYLIHCYRDEPAAHSGKRSILATASGPSPAVALESLNYQYALPIVERLKRQYQHLFS